MRTLTVLLLCLALALALVSCGTPGDRAPDATATPTPAATMWPYDHEPA
jgi:hypothetical protein